MNTIACSDETVDLCTSGGNIPTETEPIAGGDAEPPDLVTAAWGRALLAVDGAEGTAAELAALLRGSGENEAAAGLETLAAVLHGISVSLMTRAPM